MKAIEQFILRSLGEAGEDTLTALTNMAVSAGLVPQHDPVSAVLDGVSNLMAQRRVTIGEMRWDATGRECLTLLPYASPQVLSDWSSHIFWEKEGGHWAWDKSLGYSPYVVLGTASRWKAPPANEWYPKDLLDEPPM